MGKRVDLEELERLYGEPTLLAQHARLIEQAITELRVLRAECEAGREVAQGNAYTWVDSSAESFALECWKFLEFQKVPGRTVKEAADAMAKLITERDHRHFAAGKFAMRTELEHPASPDLLARVEKLEAGAKEDFKIRVEHLLRISALEQRVLELTSVNGDVPLTPIGISNMIARVEKLEHDAEEERRMAQNDPRLASMGPMGIGTLVSQAKTLIPSVGTLAVRVAALEQAEAARGKAEADIDVPHPYTPITVDADWVAEARKQNK